MMYVNQKEDWAHTSELCKRATSQPIVLTSQIFHKQHLTSTLGLFKGNSKGRHSLTQHIIARQSKCSKVDVRRATDPWLIATLASILVNIIGLTMFMVGLHRRYQVNTVKIRRVLSLHYLGLLVFRLARFRR
jgi:hypothetical protein